VPRGTYLHVDSIDGTPLAEERFSCAPGPQGWRYVAEVLDPESGAAIGGIDITADDEWRQLRVEVSSGSWVVRGGRSGAETVWVRGTDEDNAAAYGFTGRSPAFLIVTARLLALPQGTSTAIRLVDLTEPALAAFPVEQQWTLIEVASYNAGALQLPVERYEIVDRDSGDARLVHIAGDVVLDAPGVELTELDTPPSL
jgi:hypothetical protein